MAKQPNLRYKPICGAVQFDSDKGIDAVNKGGWIKYKSYKETKKRKEKYKKEYAALLKKLKDKQQQTIKERTAGEYNLKIEDYSFKILKNGRFGKEDSFEYEEEFTIGNDLIKTAGKNYILDIGKILVSQIDLSTKEKGRTNNIYMSYPRSFNYQIIVNIPDGYSVSGLENLTSNVENETGGFTSKASIEGNKLVVDIQKFYKHNYEPNSNWQKMVAFLEAASQFTQSKILLKKEQYGYEILLCNIVFIFFTHLCTRYYLYKRWEKNQC